MLPEFCPYPIPDTFQRSLLSHVIYTSPIKGGARAHVHLVDTIGLVLLGSPLSDGAGKVFENSNGVVPINAGISNGDTLLKPAWTLGGYLLVALVDI